MNPILASGIASLGHKVINNMVNSSGSAQSTASRAGSNFADLLTGTQPQQASGLEQLLSEKNVRTPQQARDVLFQMNQQLAHHPQVQQALARAEPGEALHLRVSEDGQYSIEGEDGTLATFQADSEAGQLAAQIHELNRMISLEPQMPGASVGELTRAVAAREESQPSESVWILREGVQL